MCALILILLLSQLNLVRPSDQMFNDFEFEKSLDDFEKTFISPDSLFVVQMRHLYEFGFDGKLERVYTPLPGYEITSAYYIRSQDLILILMHGDVDLMVPRKILVFERGYSVEPLAELKCNLGPTPNYFRQLIETDSGRLFLNLWYRDNITKDRDLLVEVDFSPEREGYVLRRLGPEFHKQRFEGVFWPASFKLRWVIENTDKQLLVLNQTQEALRGYELDTNGKRPLNNEDSNPLKLESWVPALEKTQSDQTRESWLFSLSRNVGMWPVEKGILIGFVSPNKKNQEYAIDFSKIEPNAPLFNLHLVILDEKGQKSKSRKIAGGVIFGVQDKKTVHLAVGSVTSGEIIKKYTHIEIDLNSPQ